MRLRRLDLSRYGKFTGHTIDFGERKSERPDFHIVYGPNEAGKSTTLAAYLDLLYGIEERSRYGFLHGYGAMEVGAALEFDGAVHELRRIKQRGGSLRDGSGQPVGEALLSGALAGLSRDAYRLMFSLDDQTLEDGGNAILDSKGDLGELLFSATAGLGGLSRTLAAISSDADAIFRKRASTTEIAALKRGLAELKEKRDAIDTQAGAYASLVADLASAERDYDSAAKERGALKARHDELAAQIRVQPMAFEYAALTEDLAGFASLPRPPGHWAKDLPDLLKSGSALETRLSDLTDRQMRLSAEIAGIVLDRNVLRSSARIEAFSEIASRFRGAESDIPKRKIALRDVDARLAAAVARIAGPDCRDEPRALMIGEDKLERIRKLLEAWSGLDVRLESAARELRMAEEAETAADAECGRLERAQPMLTAGSKAKLRTAVGRLRGSHLLADRRAAATFLADREAEMRATLSALAPWSGGIAELERMRPPSPDGLDRWRDTMTELERRSAIHQEQLRAAETERRELAARIASAEASLRAIGDDDAVSTRRARDRAWAVHRTSMTGESADAFEAALLAADAMNEARLASADRLAGLRDLRREHEVRSARIIRQTELLAEVANEREAIGSAVAASFPSAIGMEAAAPAEMISALEAWCVAREKTLSLQGQVRKAAGSVNRHDAEIDEERNALLSVLAEVDVDVAGFALEEMLTAAETRLSDDATRASSLDAADRAAREAHRIREGRAAALEVAQTDMRTWEAAWNEALSSTWFARAAMDRVAVGAVLEMLGRLPAIVSEREEILHRIESMKEDQKRYGEELAALRAALGDCTTDASAQAGTDLSDRLAVAIQARDLRETKVAELDGVQREIEALTTEAAIQRTAAAEMTSFFGVTDLVGVALLLDSCAKRDGIEASRSKLAAAITTQLGKPTVEEALSLLGETDPADRSRVHAEVAQRLEDIHNRLQSLFAVKSTAQDKLRAVGGDDAVLRIEAQRRTVVLEIQESALRFLNLKAGALLAERALLAYRDKHRGSMMDKASIAFNSMTCGAYTGLATRLGRERETLIGLSATGSKLAAEMSKGTRFQLYLALRLAGYAEFARTRVPVPFVADDIMETFDEPRSMQVLGQFGEIAKVGQVIYMTHHRHICDLAIKTVPGVGVHELGTAA